MVDKRQSFLIHCFMSREYCEGSKFQCSSFHWVDLCYIIYTTTKADIKMNQQACTSRFKLMHPSLQASVSANPCHHQECVPIESIAISSTLPIVPVTGLSPDCLCVSQTSAGDDPSPPSGSVCALIA